MHKLITTLWRSLRGPLQWRILYFFHAKFLVGAGLLRLLAVAHRKVARGELRTQIMRVEAWWADLAAGRASTRKR